MTRAPARGLCNMNLSERQRQILELLAQGRSNKEIAFALGITEGTVKQHLFTLYRKLGTTSRTKAVLAAAEHLRPAISAAAPAAPRVPADEAPASAQFVWRLVTCVMIHPQRAAEPTATARVRFEQQMNALQARTRLLADGLDGQMAIIPGGGLLVCFGLPHTHLDDPARALWLADHLHRWLRDNPYLQAGIGVASATEVVTDNAQTLHRGESIDMARALAARAQPLQVLVNEITCRLAGPVARYSAPRTDAAPGFSHRQLLVEEAVDVQALAARTPLPFMPDLLANLARQRAMWVAVEGWPPQSGLRLQDAIAVALQAHRIRTLRLRLPTDSTPAHTERCLRIQLGLLATADADAPTDLDLLSSLRLLARQGPLALICHGLDTRAALIRLWSAAALEELRQCPLIVVTSMLGTQHDSHIAARLLGPHPGSGDTLPPGKTYRLTMPAPALAPLGLHADLATLLDTLRPAARALIRRLVAQESVDAAQDPELTQELLTTGLFEQRAERLVCRNDAVRAALAALFVPEPA